MVVVVLAAATIDDDDDSVTHLSASKLNKRVGNRLSCALLLVLLFLLLSFILLSDTTSSSSRIIGCCFACKMVHDFYFRCTNSLTSRSLPFIHPFSGLSFIEKRICN